MLCTIVEYHLGISAQVGPVTAPSNPVELHILKYAEQISGPVACHHIVSHEAWQVTAPLMLTPHKSAGSIKSDTAKTHTHNSHNIIQQASRVPQSSSSTLIHFPCIMLVPCVRICPLAPDGPPACSATAQEVPG